MRVRAMAGSVAMALAVGIPAEGQTGDVELVGEGVVSTERNETFPAQDPVTGALWFSVYEGSFADQSIMVAERTDDGWSTPVRAPFSGRWGDRAPRFSPDGSALYFTSNRPRPSGDEAGDMNLWRVRRTAGGWGEPELMPEPFNSAAEDIHAAVTADALWLASNREGGKGRSDLYRVARDGTLFDAGDAVNDELSQPDVWVSEDETVMVLAITDHPDGLGGDDLYISRNDGSGWSAPVNLGPGINTPEYEYGPTLSRDGRYLFFTSHRSGSADVYRVPLDVVVGGRP